MRRRRLLAVAGFAMLLAAAFLFTVGRQTPNRAFSRAGVDAPLIAAACSPLVGSRTLLGLHVAESESYQRLPTVLTSLHPPRISIGSDCVVLDWGGSDSYGLFYAPASCERAVVARFSEAGVESLGSGVFLFGY